MGAMCIRARIFSVPAATFPAVILRTWGRKASGLPCTGLSSLRWVTPPLMPYGASCGLLWLPTLALGK